jgi:hypothetical protein
MEEQTAGRWFRSDTRFGPLFHAHLFAGQENFGKLVTMVKQQARLRALDSGADLLIVDGPPGIGCPVIAASAGADLTLLVVEPTISGIHDLKRILATTDHFGLPALVCINKADINPARADEISAFCAAEGIALVGQVPFDTVVTEAMVQGLPVTEYDDGPVTMELKAVWLRIRKALNFGLRIMGSIVAVCASQRRMDPKKDIGEGYLQEGHGLVGDAHAGSSERQVSLLALESIERANNGYGIKAGPGDFAENLTTQGIDLLSLPIGTRLQAGEAVLEVVQIGKPLHMARTYNFQGISLLPTEGIFCRVIKSGWVRNGDEIVVLPENHP